MYTATSAFKNKPVAASAAPGTPLLLDTYTGAEGAWSIRKLRTAYSGDSIRIRVFTRKSNLPN